MMNPPPWYFALLTWMLMGPPPSAELTITLMVASVAATLALKRSFRGRTIALLGILGMMLAQNSLLVVATSYIDTTRRPLGHLTNISWSHFLTPRTIDLTIALTGIFAAACIALLISFGKSRISISKAFPQLRFLETPVEVKETVDRLANLAGITSPDVGLMDSGVPSTFTVRANGRYSVLVSVGLLESLGDKEIEACIAHEISHLKNNDFTVRFLATIAKVALFAKPLSYLIEPAVYRAREFLADTTAAELIGGPDALISALSKLKESYSIAAASVFDRIGICNLSGRKGLLGIFDKHPDLETRIKMLEEMKRA